MTWLKRVGIAVFAACVLLHPPSAGAADNAATAGIGGLDNGTILNGDGTGRARISLFTAQLALIKQARELDGTVLSDGASVSQGDELYFVLYVDNTTGAPAFDLRIDDGLDELAFAYQPGSLEQTVVPSGSSDAAIWAGVWTPQTDALGAPDDEAAALDTGGTPTADRITAGAVPGQANQTIDVPALSLRALRFRVTVN